MKLSQYQVVLHGEDGRIHVNVTCDDGSTFGQWIKPGTQQEMDQQVKEAVARVAAQQAPATPIPAIGTTVTAAEVLATTGSVA